jgi:transcriptional regulator with XRE-family HTH domain
MDSGQYLKNIILSRNLSIRDFSEKSALSYDLICNAIHGKTKSPKVLAKIARALDINPEILIEAKDLKTTINTFVEINSSDKYYMLIKDMILNRLKYFNIEYKDGLINKIAHSIFYYIKQVTHIDDNVIEKMVDGIILYGIMESKIKEKE